MTYEVATEYTVMMATEDKAEAIDLMHEIIDGNETAPPMEAWINVFDENDEYIETIEA